MKITILISLILSTVTCIPINNHENTLDYQFEPEPEPELIDLSKISEQIYAEPDEETGRKLEEFNVHESNLNPEEIGNYYEGDILVPDSVARSALSGPSTRWPHGIIPYTIDPQFCKIFTV